MLCRYMVALMCSLYISIQIVTSQRCQATNSSIVVQQLFDNSQANYNSSLICAGGAINSSLNVTNFPNANPTSKQYELWKLYNAVWVNCSYSSNPSSFLNAFTFLPNPVRICVYSSSLYCAESIQSIARYPAYGIAITNCGLTGDDLSTVFKLYKQALGNTTFDFNFFSNNINSFSLTALLSYCSRVMNTNPTRPIFTRRPQVGLFNLSHNLIEDISKDQAQIYTLLNYRNYQTTTSDSFTDKPDDVVQQGFTVSKLDLSFNNIASEWALRTLCNVNGLQHLHLQNNDLQLFGYVLGNCLPSLTLLDLSANKLTFITDGAFAATSLVSVDLSNNYLTTVKSTMFPSTLQALMLQNNEITALSQYDLSPMLPSVFIDLHSNPVDCCAMRWFMSAIDNSDTYSDYSPLQCHYPANVSLPEVAASGCEPPTVTSLMFDSDNRTVHCSFSGSALAMQATLTVTEGSISNFTLPNCLSYDNGSTYELCASLQQGITVTSAVCSAINFFGNISMHAILRVPASASSSDSSGECLFTLSELIGTLVAVFVLTAILAVALTLVIVHCTRHHRQQQQQSRQQVTAADRKLDTNRHWLLPTTS